LKDETRRIAASSKQQMMMMMVKTFLPGKENHSIKAFDLSTSSPFRSFIRSGAQNKNHRRAKSTKEAKNESLKCERKKEILRREIN